MKSTTAAVVENASAAAVVGNVCDLAVGRTAGGMICKERYENAGTGGVRDVAGTVGVRDVAGTVGVLAVAAVLCVVVVVSETPTGTAEAGRQTISL